MVESGKCVMYLTSLGHPTGIGLQLGKGKGRGVFIPPTSKKLRGHIGSVHLSVHLLHF